jgi:hypothetical protein
MWFDRRRRLVRYARHGLAGLGETRQRSAAPKYGAAHDRRILALLARELGDIHEQYIWRFLRAQKIDLSEKNHCWGRRIAAPLGCVLIASAVVVVLEGLNRTGF